MADIKIKINGMSCNHCKMAIERVLASILGITGYQVHLETGLAEISGQPDIDQVVARIKELGYEAIPIGE